MQISKLFSIEGKTVIITGCGSGIGLEVAKGFILNGANVIGISRTKPIGNLQFKNFFESDLTNENEISFIVNFLKDKGIMVDVLMNIAGISLSSSENKDEMIRFDKTLNINLKAMYNVINQFRPLLISGSSIINFSSIGGRLGFPDNPSYCASKGGVLSLSKALANDLGSKNIRINCIVPGYFHTKMTAESYFDSEKKRIREKRTILGRWGELDEILGASIFLASNASSYMTGSEITIDGGWSSKGL